jgi:ABC-type phosphate transport system substrate-binding protein
MKKMITLLLACFFSGVMMAQAGSIIIANKDVPTETLSFGEVQRIFLGKKTTWENGQKIIPICLKSGATHINFLRTYLDMNPSQFDIFWKQAVFTGTGRPPKALEDEADMVQLVKSTAGAVGYINADTLRGTLKIIEVK